MDEIEIGLALAGAPSATYQITSPMPLTLQFEVTLAGDEMSGVVKLGIFGKAKFAATRAS